MQKGHKFEYILQGEIVQGMYKGEYRENRQNTEDLHNFNLYEPIRLFASNLTELKQLFQKRYGLEIKGKKLEDRWYVVYPGTKSCFGFFNITRR